MKLSGVISDRIRALLAAGKLDDRAINPGRPADAPPPKRGTKLPKGVEGHSLGGRHRKGK